jgi:cell wall-associated NlpC family hydrolase
VTVRARLAAAALVGVLAALSAAGQAGAVGEPTPDPSASGSAEPATTAPSPSPSEPVASPEATSPQPTPGPSEATSPPAAPSPTSTAIPVPPAAPTSTAAPTLPPSVASPTPSPSASGGGRTPLPRTDGVVPDLGELDEYLELTGRRDEAAVRLEQAHVAYAEATRAVAGLVAERDAADEVRIAAAASADATQSDVEDVARDLYQSGDAGIGALATVISSGPSGLIDRLDNARKAGAAARGIVNDAQDARAELALANATVLALTLRIDAASGAVATTAQAVKDAEAALAAIDAQLEALAISAPQQQIGPDGCPTANVPGTLRDGSDSIGAPALCRAAVRQAATPQAALAIQWAFRHLGAPYACGGAGRLEPFRMDCSSFVSRAYAEGAGLRTAGPGWAPSTRNMVPWDGVALDPHYAFVAPVALRAGDLVTYDTCPQGGCPYKHVVMYLGSPDGGQSFWMAHTNACGDIAKIERFWGFPSSGHPFLVARRVVALPGEVVSRPAA